jgi:hypothetical protein
MRDRTTDSYQVFTIDNGTAHLKVVVTGETDGDWIRIISGLTGTETVAIAKLNELFDGAAVAAGS